MLVITLYYSFLSNQSSTFIFFILQEKKWPNLTNWRYTAHDHHSIHSLFFQRGLLYKQTPMRLRPVTARAHRSASEHCVLLKAQSVLLALDSDSQDSTLLYARFSLSDSPPSCLSRSFFVNCYVDSLLMGIICVCEVLTTEPKSFFNWVKVMSLDFHLTSDYDYIVPSVKVSLCFKYLYICTAQCMSK